MKLEELETPALIVDLDVMEKNIQSMSDYCERSNLKLRPHTKTHKSPKLAHLQLERGASGITVAKLGEAEVMSDGGLADILLAYPVFGEWKVKRLRQLLERTRVTVALDSEDSAGWVSQAADGKRIEVLVEIDLGMRRCGLAPGEEPIRLARYIDQTKGLRFAGLLYYSGHVHPDLDGNKRTLQRLNDDLNRQMELFGKEGIGVETVSGGSTPAAFYSHEIEALTEIRPGTYIFNDRNTIEWGACRLENCAASILVTVVSNCVPGQAIIDGGSKTFSSDGLMTGPMRDYGLIREHETIRFTRMNEEHGYLKLPDDVHLEVGKKLQIVPNHICAAVNMHERVWGVLKGQVVEEWEVKARGKIR